MAAKYGSAEYEVELRKWAFEQALTAYFSREDIEDFDIDEVTEIAGKIVDFVTDN